MLNSARKLPCAMVAAVPELDHECISVLRSPHHEPRIAARTRASHDGIVMFEWCFGGDCS